MRNFGKGDPDYPGPPPPTLEEIERAIKERRPEPTGAMQLKKRIMELLQKG